VNGYAAFILIALLADYAIGLIADILNLRHQSPTPPEEFRDLIDPENYHKNREYLKVTTVFDQVAELFNLAAILIFWGGGGFRKLDLWCRQLSDSPLLQGLCFIGFLLLARALINLPFSLYRTFVIEERFGFNRTSWKTFLLDRAKIIILTLLLGTPLLAAILWFLESAGEQAWLFAWLTTAIFTLAIQIIAPTWIMPLFNKFTPLEDGELKETLQRYGRQVDFPLDQVFIIDGSKRSGKGNAFFTGFGRHRRVALYDTLVSQHTPNELKAILAHEIGHYKKKHILIMTTIAIIHQGIIFYLLGWFIKQPDLYRAFGLEHISPAAGLVFFSLLFTPVEMIISPLFQALSRRHEFQADAFAAATTKDAETLITALKKLARDNLANLTPHPFYVFLHYSHPPLLNRIQALRRNRRTA